jgi:hypothetical protein
MAVIAFSAVAFAALRTASDLWFSAFYTATFVLLLVAVVAAFVRRGRERAFWCGLAVFGWGFFLLGLGPWHSPYAGPEEGRDEVLNRDLLTAKAVLFLVPRLRKQEGDWDELKRITSNTIGIAHLLLTIGIALIGGLIATSMRRRRSRPPVDRAANTTTVLAVVMGLSLVAGAALSANDDRGRTPFFPPDVERGEEYAKCLDAMGEPSLLALAAQGQKTSVCRLLWPRGGNQPVAVRIERTAHGAQARVVVLDSVDFESVDDRFAFPSIDRRFTIRDREWTELEQRLETIGFEDMPTNDPAGFGPDEDRYIIEAVKDGKYHVVDRAELRGIYHALCRYIFEVARFKP